MNLLKEFLDYLTNEEKEKAVNLILTKLANKEIDIITLYEEILTPSLNEVNKNTKDENEAILKEHIRSSIVRTIIECSYPYLIKERNEKYKRKDKTILVMCPTEELHEIGARIISDYFTLFGYNSYFVGANTPKETLMSAIKTLNLNYIAISVTNSYNLVATQRTIDYIRKDCNYKGNIIVGGRAFNNNPKIYSQIGADLLLMSYKDIEVLGKGDEQ